MSRLGKRVEKLEGGVKGGGVSIFATVPYDWPKERINAEVTAIALENGVSLPFGMCFFTADRQSGGEDGVEVLFMGKFGVDTYFDERLTRNKQGAASMTSGPKSRSSTNM